MSDVRTEQFRSGERFRSGVKMQYVTAAGLPPVSKIGLGTMRFGERTFSPDLARQLVRRALELGITHFDTAESYGFGRSERLLGEALAAQGAREADGPVTSWSPASSRLCYRCRR
jgi:diketogulonate reductase-like aldo/keto reductase